MHTQSSSLIRSLLNLFFICLNRSCIAATPRCFSSARSMNQTTNSRPSKLSIDMWKCSIDTSAKCVNQPAPLIKKEKSLLPTYLSRSVNLICEGILPSSTRTGSTFSYIGSSASRELIWCGFDSRYTWHSASNYSSRPLITLS